MTSTVTDRPVSHNATTLDALLGLLTDPDVSDLIREIWAAAGRARESAGTVNRHDGLRETPESAAAEGRVAELVDEFACGLDEALARAGRPGRRRAA